MTLAARRTDPDGHSGRVFFNIYDAAGVFLFSGVGNNDSYVCNGCLSYYTPSLAAGTYQWLSYSHDGYGFGAVTPRFTFAVQTPPDAPTGLQPDAVVLPTTTPTLTATYTDPNIDPGQVYFEVFESQTGVRTSSGFGEVVQSGGDSAWQVPAGQLTPGMAYRVDAAAYDRPYFLRSQTARSAFSVAADAVASERVLLDPGLPPIGGGSLPLPVDPEQTLVCESCDAVYKAAGAGNETFPLHTFNMNGAGDRHKGAKTPASYVIQQVRSYKVPVAIALTEVCAGEQFNTLETAFRQMGYAPGSFFQTRTPGLARCPAAGNALFVMGARGADRRFAYTDQDPEDFRPGGNREVRMVGCIPTNILAGPLVACVTHVDPSGLVETRQAREAFYYHNGAFQGLRRFLSGDFNLTPPEMPSEWFLKYREVWPTCFSGQNCPAHATHSIQGKIDYVWARQEFIRVSGAAVLLTPGNISDHRYYLGSYHFRDRLRLKPCRTHIERGCHRGQSPFLSVPVRNGGRRDA